MFAELVVLFPTVAVVILFQEWPVKGGHADMLDVHSKDLLITGLAMSHITACVSLLSFRNCTCHRIHLRDDEVTIKIFSPKY